MAFFSGNHGWSLAVVIGRLAIGVVPEQEFNHRTIAVLSGGVNWCPASMLTGIDEGSVFEQ